MSREFYIGYVIVLAAVSLVAFILYGADKYKAKKGRWRIKESVLLLFGFLGGAVGALVGMNLFRHKTKHWYFIAINLIALLLHAGIFIALYYFI